MSPLPWPYLHPQLYSLYCRIFRGNPSLCEGSFDGFFPMLCEPYIEITVSSTENNTLRVVVDE